jgi:ArsR family transcriptional regulator, arsenate/arsenite/antimonite-responsive transcriptional repressor
MQLSEITTIGQLFSEEARVRILCLLNHYGEACLADLNQVLEYETQKTHRHIKYIESAGYLSSVRYGQWVFYSLPMAIPEALGAMIKSAEYTKQVQQDMKKYGKLLKDGDLAASQKAREVAEAK